MIKHIEQDKFEVNNKPCNEQEVLNLLLEYPEEGFLSEYITQSEFPASLYPNSTNTMRIVCAKMKGERDFQIVAAAQRIGSDESKPVDNLSSGGLACRIDLETGELGVGRILKACDIEHCKKHYEKHPDTGLQLKGQVVPNWNNVKKEILALTSKFPYFNLIAWDVLMTDKGYCLIEGNVASGINLIQTDKGLKKEAYGKILRSHGINSVNNIKIKKY